MIAAVFSSPEPLSGGWKVCLDVYDGMKTDETDLLRILNGSSIRLWIVGCRSES